MRPPPINYAAVAQVGRQQRQRPPNLLNMGPKIPGILQAPGLGAPLPRAPKLPGLSKAEKRAMGIIQSPIGLQTGTPRKILQHILNPTPKMMQHIDYLGLHKEAANTANDAQFSLTGHLPQQEIKRIRKSVQRMPQPAEAGLVPGFDNPVTRWVQRGVTGEAEVLKQFPAATIGLIKHSGMGLANVAEGLGEGLHLTHRGGMQGGVAEVAHPHYFKSQAPYFKEQLKATAESYEKMFTTRMIWDDPAQFFNNAITLASVGAGTGLRVARIGAVARELKAGTITREEALTRVGKIVKRPEIERQILIGRKDKHFDRSGRDKLGLHKDDFQTVRHDLPGQPHHLSMPIYAHTKNPEESIIGAPGGMHADYPEGRKRGLTQVTGIIDPDTGRVVRANMIGKAGGMSDAKFKALQEKLVDLANEKLNEAGHDPYLRPQAVKGALGGLVQKHVFDPLTERGIRGKDIGVAKLAPGLGREIPSVRNPLVGVSATGRAGKIKRMDVELEQNMARTVAEVREAKRLGIPGPYDKVEKHHVPMPTGEGPLTAEQHWASLSKKEREALQSQAQANAYAIGPMEVHAKNWHDLYHGGMDAKDTIEKHPNDYIGIKRPPDKKPKKVGSYAGEKRIAESWHDMVEHNPRKMLENPDAYSYYPRGMWQRMKPGKPGEGAAAGLFKTIDAVTQMVRSGRFMTPAYAAWFLQNGVLHLSQAGAYTLRNIHLLRTEWDKMSPEAKANFDGSVGASHYGGGIARTGEGSETTPFLHPRIKTFTHKLAKFWHAVDDRPWRRMSLIHELYRQGYKTADSWEKLINENPKKFRSIARQAQREAIDYSEMGPAEKETFQKMFIAWGWTRGATTYTARFPFQHPAQFSVFAQQGRQGQENMKEWWRRYGGMSPQWLEDFMPLTGGPHPSVMSTGLLSPGETPAAVAEAIPGLTIGQRSSLSEEESPAISALQSALTGTDIHGRPLVGSERISGPLGELFHRFRPIGMLENLASSHHGGGTFIQGPKNFALGLTGIGVQQLRDPRTAAALGVKDYEKALPKPDEIRFRHEWTLEMLPHQLALYKRKSGQALDDRTIAQIKGDLDAVEQRDMFQYKWAADRGAHSFRSLPAVDRVKAGIKFMLDHHYFTRSDALDMQHYMTQVKDEKEMDQAASQIWGAAPIGQTLNQWNSMMRQLQPSPLEASRG